MGIPGSESQSTDAAAGKRSSFWRGFVVAMVLHLPAQFWIWSVDQTGEELGIYEGLWHSMPRLPIALVSVWFTQLLYEVPFLVGATLLRRYDFATGVGTAILATAVVSLVIFAVVDPSA